MDKAVPNNVQAEQSVIASILVDPELLPQARAVLTGVDFFDNQCRYVWLSITDLYDHKETVNQLTVWNELEVEGKLGFINRDSMSNWIAELESCYMIDSYIEVVKRNSIARQLIHVADVIAKIAYENNLTAVTMVHRALTALDGIEVKPVENDGIKTAYKGLRRAKGS
ncbi:MAG: DnaB-like helicase N-terminal domain-containing protein [Dehalococcoidia bacterium]|nr:DnaB-like helicase N-terminal domain-containing protein [Dehalococcoidia bacterium]